MPIGWSHTDANGFLLDNGGGSDRYAFIPTDDAGVPLDLPASSSIVAELVDTGDEVGVLVYASGDRNSGWRIGVDGTDVFIQKMTYSVLAAASATAPHSVAGGAPIKLEIRPTAGTGNKIEVRINDDPSVVVEYDITDADSFAHLGGYGFDSDVDGARVASFSVAQLVPTYLGRADIPWFVCGGELYVSLDGGFLTLIDRRALNAAATLVDGAELDQKVYMVDGANAKVFSAATLLVEKWVPSAGQLPGQTADGTTSSVLAEQYNGRVLTAEEQNLFATAINNALDMDVSVVSGGAAWALGTQAAKIGQPIRSVLRLGKTTLLIGCSRSVWVMRGDFALGAVELDPILEGGIGVTGKDAMLRVSDDAALLHTTQGFYAVTASRTAHPLSQLVLTSLIVVDTINTEYIVHLCRDVKRSGTLIFLTTKETGPSIHIWYDERTGKFLPPEILGQRTGGGAGYFPEQYPDRVGPMCSMEFEGKVYMGGRDGYVYTFDDDANTDDGDAIESTAAFLVLHEEDLQSGVKLHQIDTMLADWSGPVVLSVYSGQTVEEAYKGEDRALRRRVTSSPRRQCHTINVSGPYLVVEIAGSGNQPWGIEPMQATTSRDSTRSSSWLPKPSPEAPCAVPVPETPVEGEGPGAGEPVGGGSGKCTACGDWMDANTTGTVGGEDAYLLSTASAQTLAAASITAFNIATAKVEASDICDVGGENPVVLYAVGSIDGVIIGTLAEMQANGAGAQDWEFSFRCADQPGIAEA